MFLAKDDSRKLMHCPTCLVRTTEQARSALGCRKPPHPPDNKNKYPLWTGSEVGEGDKIDHCPGFYLDTPYTRSVVELYRAWESGLFAKPDYLSLPNPVAESIGILRVAILDSETLPGREKNEPPSLKGAIPIG